MHGNICSTLCNLEDSVHKLAPLLALTVFTFGSLLCSGQSDGSTAGTYAAASGSAPSAPPSQGPAETAKTATTPASNAGAAVPVVQTTSQAEPAPARMTSRVGIGIKVSLLGAGIDVATPITHRTNLRVGFNAFSYARGFDSDGIHYRADLNFRSAEAHFDWFPFAGGFHLSPGVMVYNGNQIKANAAVGGGQQFSLGDVTYMSDTTTPVTGTGKLVFNKAAPTFLLGWGNLLPRSSRHFSVPFEFGVVIQGSPQASINLMGTACDVSGANCRDIAGDPSIQSNIQAQQKKLNDDMAAFKVYPVVSLGFGYKF